MIQKASILILLIFLIQFISSCDDCGSEHYGPYEITYTDVAITSWDTAGFQSKEVVDSVYKHAFGLSLYVNHDSKEIAVAKSASNIFGFNTTLACSPVEPQYIYLDSIADVKIFVLDAITNDETDVTTKFVTYSYYDQEPISIEEYINTRADRYNWDYFQALNLDLIETDSIPNEAIFTVHVYLASGVILTNQTKKINFYN